MPKAFSEREKEIIHQRLLEKGRALFAAHGLKKTNVEDLTQAAGISKGAFYLFYSSKEELYFEVIAQAEEDFRRQVFAGIREAQGSPRQRFAALLQRAFHLWKQTPELRQFDRSEYELLLSKLPEEQIHDHLRSDDRFLQELVAALRREGVEVTLPIPELAGLMTGLFFISMHEDDFGPGMYTGTINLLIELIAAHAVAG